MESAQDPQLGQENNTMKDAVPKSQAHDWQDSAPLDEPLLPSKMDPHSVGYSAADDETRRRMSRRVILISAYHLLFVSAMCIAVFGGYVDGKPWSVAFWLMLVELAVLLTVLALKMVEMYQYDH